MNRNKITKDIIAAAVGAKTHFDIWWTLASEARLRFSMPMTEHSDFFNATHDAHYVAFFIYFAQLFDKRRDAISLTRYLQLKKADLNSDQYDKFCEWHARLLKNAQPLLEIRHNLIAHVNAMHTENSLFSTLDATWNGMRETIYEVGHFVAQLVGVRDVGQIGIPRDGRLNEATIRLLQSLGEESDA